MELARNRAESSRWSSRALGASLVVLAPLLSRIALADEPPKPIPPPFLQLRFEEDYAYLADRSKRREQLDALKHIGLGGSSYLSIGGEARERYEWYRNQLGGFGPQDDNGYFLHRFMLHGDLRLGKHVRVFSQVLSALLSDRTDGPRPMIDEDRLDLHQAFVEATLGGNPKDSIGARLGRQEFSYGVARLIGTREGPNVRLSFDAAKVLIRKGGWTVDAFWGRPVLTPPGTWDDHADESLALWGVYATRAVPLLPDGHADVYYLGLDREDAPFTDGIGHERRQSVGLRLSGKPKPWDYDVEGVFQFGDFTGRPIRAWMISGNVGYRPPGLSVIRLSLRADAASGDRSPGDGLQTFNALFPRASFFGEPALVGPPNIVDLHPIVDVDISDKLHIYTDWDVFWRQSTRDGLYGPAGFPIRPGGTSGARYIGNQVQVGLKWEPDRHVTFNAVYAHFFAGSFVQESGPGEDTDYVSLWVTFRF